MRVLHLPVNNGSRTSHTVRALRQVGIDAFGLVRTRALIQSPEGLKVINLGPRGLSGRLVVSLLPWIYNYIKWVRWADLVHWYSGAMALPCGLDLAIVRALRKPGIVEWQGAEIRIPEVEFAENPYYTAVYDHGYEYRQYESWQQSRALQQRFRDAGFACAAPPGMLQYVQPDIFPRVHVLPRRLILSEYAPHFPEANRARPLVIHSPTAPIGKGTAAVLKAVADLKTRCDFEFRLVQGLSRGQALRLMQEADIFLDQFVVGDYGSASLEAMAYGKPVICYLKPSVIARYPDDLPIVNASQEDLAVVLADLLADGGRRALLGRQGRAYVEQHNDAAHIVRSLVDIYDQLLPKH